MLSSILNRSLPTQAVKVFSTVFIGFFFSLFTTTFSVLGLRKLQGTAVDAPVEAAADAAPAGGSAPKAFSDEMMDFMLKGTVLSGAISIAASKTDQAYKTPLQTIFMGFATFTSFIWGARMPAAVTKFLHPILTSTGMSFATARLIGMATGSSFVDVLKEYKCGSLGAMTAGAGDLILYMLGPAVISFAIAMYSRKGVIASNLPTVTTGVAMGSAGGLFGTAAFARALGIGGPDGCMVRLSTIPRNITTALAMVIAKLLGGDTSIAAVLCVLTGMFAAMVGAKTLDAWVSPIPFPAASALAPLDRAWARPVSPTRRRPSPSQLLIWCLPLSLPPSLRRSRPLAMLLSVFLVVLRSLLSPLLLEAVLSMIRCLLD